MRAHDRRDQSDATDPVTSAVDPMLESEFTHWLIDHAQWCGWHVTHFRPAMMRSGRWATALQGNAGFPDLVLVHDGIGGGVIFAELKVGKNKVSDKQQTWIDRLQAAGAEAHVWRPSDMWQISRRLKRLDVPKEEL